MSDGKMPDMGSLMNIAQQLQGNMAKMQEDLADKQVEAASGGGMVTAVVNGHYQLVSLKLEKEVVDPADVGMLQDLIVAAINQANTKMREEAQQEMSKLTGGLNIPGMPNLF